MNNMNSPLSLRSLALALLLSTPLIACDDEGGSSGSSASPAAPADLSASVEGAETESTLSELSEEQATAICEAQRAYFTSQVSEDQLKRSGCALGAALAASFGGEDAPSCDDAYSACLAAPAEMTEGEDSCDTSMITGCDATVSQLEACIEEQVNMVRALATLTCSDLTDPSALSSGTSSAEATACAELAEICPEFGDM